ncbi:MAG: DUF1643 domain-containing protein [Clostridiales bacterium]|jgi:hypothetical protein|nr:DUF1643 domain-containing protein [Clostridiales bacterium]
MTENILTKTACEFDLALHQALVENEEYDVNKWLYVPNEYRNYRYILGTTGKNPLICIGINPSTAKPDQLDNTLKSVDRISRHNGYDGFIMFNVYAHRATDPNNMEKELNKYLHCQNMKAFEYVLKNTENSTPSLWAAWGTIIEKRDYLSYCLKDMIDIGVKYEADWYTAGKRSIKGHPHHPLYLKKDSKLDEFDVRDYSLNV